MIPVFLLGEEHDAALRLPLCRILERYGGVLHICGAHAAQYAIGQARFLLCETSRLESIQAEQAILIFKSQQAISCGQLSLSDGVYRFWKQKTRRLRACCCTRAPLP
mgnify:CR=1 FL=1